MDSDIQYLPGVGPKRAALLRSELDINKIGDLIRLYPFRYIDRSTVTPIDSVVPDAAFVQIQATVVSSEFSGKKLTVWVEDETGRMELVFFKGIKYTADRLQPGKTFLFFGKPTIFGSRINMVHPEIDQPGTTGGAFVPGTNPGTSTGAQAAPGSGAMTGVYTSTDRLKNAGITNKVMNKLMANALQLCLPEVEETLPDYVLKERNLVGLPYALKNIHFPSDAYALRKAINRLKFEELFLLQLSLLKQKYIRSRSDKGIPMPKVGDAFNRCYDALPYELTGAQKRVIKEIRNDLMSGRQMNRLLQGDVGSGKTMVAVLSALIAVGNGCQACIMAPTEVLAQQHFANISKYLKPTGVEVALLTGSTKTSERKRIHQGLEDGSLGIIVGTHALIEDNVIFHRLGLAIVDEQHRFGVDQRAKLWRKGAPGRKPIQTLLITESKRAALWKFIRDQIALGRQAFIVYPLIFESEKVDYQNLEQGYEQVVRAFPFPPYKVAIVHGQQSSEDKAFNMNAFAAGRANILVSTTVIEVGVDVPNASVMVIESAERFGLSQLHQLRGRVGRGSDKSFCILVKGLKVSKESEKRLELLCETENGFELAEEDMKMRGPGDLEGTQQSGLPVNLAIASLAKDGALLGQARTYAEQVLERDPLLEKPENARLTKELRKYKVHDYSQIS